MDFLHVHLKIHHYNEKLWWVDLWYFDLFWNFCIYSRFSFSTDIFNTCTKPGSSNAFVQKAHHHFYSGVQKLNVESLLLKHACSIKVDYSNFMNIHGSPYWLLKLIPDPLKRTSKFFIDNIRYQVKQSPKLKMFKTVQSCCMVGSNYPTQWTLFL